MDTELGERTHHSHGINRTCFVIRKWCLGFVTQYTSDKSKDWRDCGYSLIGLQRTVKFGKFQAEHDGIHNSIWFGPVYVTWDEVPSYRDILSSWQFGLLIAIANAMYAIFSDNTFFPRATFVILAIVCMISSVVCYINAKRKL